MSCRIAELRHKEVINQSDGMRLGFVDDVEIDTKNACLISVIIYGRPKLFGILDRHDDIMGLTKEACNAIGQRHPFK